MSARPTTTSRYFGNALRDVDADRGLARDQRPGPGLGLEVADAVADVEHQVLRGGVGRAAVGNDGDAGVADGRQLLLEGGRGLGVVGCRDRRGDGRDVVLDGVELGKGLGLAFFGGEHLIDFFGGDAIGQQRPFHVHLRTLAQTTFAGEGFGVEEIRDGLGAFAVLSVHRKDDGPHDVADATFIGQRVFDEVIRRCGTIVPIGQDGLVDHFQITFGAGALEVDHFDVDHIPQDVPGFDLRLHLGHAAAVVFEQHVGAGFLHVGFNHVLHLCRAIGAAKRCHRQILSQNGAGKQRRRGQIRQMFLHRVSPCCVQVFCGAPVCPRSPLIGKGDAIFRQGQQLRRRAVFEFWRGQVIEHFDDNVGAVGQAEIIADEIAHIDARDEGRRQGVVMRVGCGVNEQLLGPD